MHGSASPACRSERGNAAGSIRRLDSMSEGRAVANRGKAARTEYRDCTNEKITKISGGDALRGNTRSHPEHEG